MADAPRWLRFDRTRMVDVRDLPAGAWVLAPYFPISFAPPPFSWRAALVTEVAVRYGEAAQQPYAQVRMRLPDSEDESTYLVPYGTIYLVAVEEEPEPPPF